MKSADGMTGLAPVAMGLTHELLLVRLFVAVEAGAAFGMIVGRFPCR